jgi:hypothetical protein
MYAGSIRVLVFVRTLFHKKRISVFSSLSSLFFSFFIFFPNDDDDVHRINYALRKKNHACVLSQYNGEKTRKEIVIDKKKCSLDSPTLKWNLNRLTLDVK